jgi:hypothetical protein
MNKFVSFVTIIFLVSCNYNQKMPDQASSSDTKTLTSSEFSLDDVQYRTFNYFWELAEPENGQIPDRYPTESFSSIAATGFGLVAYIVGVERKFITRAEAAERVLKTLRFFTNLKQGPERSEIGGYKGFYYHFLDMKSGHRFKQVELSTIDTGLLMAGILCCQSYFDGDTNMEKEIRELADVLFRRVEWDWAMAGEEILSMGWHPESGFLSAKWYGYNEAMVLIIMAMGSPTHPIPSTAWDAWTSRYNWAEWYGYEHVNFGPLFGHQYSHMFIDFREIKDTYMREKGIDYYENSRRATYAQQAYCAENPLSFRDYSSEIWGLTACDGPGYAKHTWQGREIEFRAYSARGTAVDYHVDDGTIAPTAAGGSIPFAPEICIPALKAIYDKYGQSVYQEYGFKDSFNPTYTWGSGNESGWVDKDYIGIDQGPIVLMIENYHSGLIWDLLKKNPYIVNGLQKAGFKGGWLENL